ncbi:MAG: 50S ribosomal protein L6 [candidate division WOR-3 bacterium]
MAKVYRPLGIPDGVQVKVDVGSVTVTGKLGSIVVPVLPGLSVKVETRQLVVEPGPGAERAHVGTLRSHLSNAMVGVVSGFERVLQVRGMGYRVQKTKEGVQIQCGFSHPVDVVAPPGITFEVTQAPNPDDTKQQMFEITVKGVDRHAVGQIAAQIRAIKPPDPYRGKGIRYRDEYVRKKAGKRAVGAEQA